MNRTKLSWTVANIEKMYKDKKVLSFDHPIQRKSEIWTNSQKSLLIHSMLANYPIPNVYVLREDSEQVDEKNRPIFNYYVMDGKQRLTSTLSYLWGEFPLDENIPDIMVEDTAYEIAGKYFCDLDEPVQFEIRRYKFEIIAFEECSNREIEEIFFRLNNSTVLTKSQIAKCKVGVELAGMINEILSSRFFTISCNFSAAQLKVSDDQRVLIQSMILLDTNYIAGFEMRDFSEDSILAYSGSIRGNYSDRQSNLLKSAIQYLSDAFPEKNKQIRKISIPMLVYLADVAEDTEIRPMYFRQWFEFFTEEDSLFEDYQTFCGSGSTKLEKVNGRLAVMTRSFCNYHEIEIPEELKETVAEVEEKLAAKKENEEEVSSVEAEGQAEENDESSEAENNVESEEIIEADTKEADIEEDVSTEEISEGKDRSAVQEDTEQENPEYVDENPAAAEENKPA